MLQHIEDALGYSFVDKDLLAVALTHSSYANEHGGGAEHNERLEFLGDAVLELCVSSELFNRFSDVREGDLTRMRAKIVSQPFLSGLAQECGLDTALLLGKGEESQGGRERPSLLSDAFEALLGAVYLDGGFDAVTTVVRTVFDGKWPVQKQGGPSKDCKSLLQEVTQRRFKERPVYALVGSSGPEHAKVFTVRVTLPDNREFISDGPSLKRAEQIVACLALEHILPEEELPFPDDVTEDA
ncbi:Ribonuclease 3 [uncultured delta proteobacterium]|uniref:Ribonuclease 3 n=1 Tax=uncultured delta proteobacterium TaxID=34034 RepID=A0A212IU50_9DELT|nr:Ribonuclease 3 [uncultured delta proteobacterium]